MRKNLEYLYNVARQMMGEQEVWRFISETPDIVNATSFRLLFSMDVERALRTWGDDKLGMLAALGRGGGEIMVDHDTKEDDETRQRFGISSRSTLTEVGLGKVMTEHMSGRVLLLKLASLTVVAAMLDLARNRQDASVDVVDAFEQMPDRASHF